VSSPTSCWRSVRAHVDGVVHLAFGKELVIASVHLGLYVERRTTEFAPFTVCGVTFLDPSSVGFDVHNVNCMACLAGQDKSTV